MLRGLITDLLIKLTFEYWYFVILALLIKAALIRFTVTDSIKKIVLFWLIGTVTFYFTACMAGIVFTTVSFYYQPFIMFVSATLIELFFMSIMFRTEVKILLPSVVIGDGVFFFLLFWQMI